MQFEFTSVTFIFFYLHLFFSAFTLFIGVLLLACSLNVYVSFNSRRNKTRLSSTTLHGLYREADWNENQQTRGGVTRP